MSHKEFVDWWETHHVPKVLAMRGVLHYAIYPIDGSYNVATNEWSEADQDGMAIIYFESRAALDDAMKSPEGLTDRMNLVKAETNTRVYGGKPRHKRGMF